MSSTIPNVIIVDEPSKHVIRAYKERPKKDDDQCAMITLATRKYAYLRRRQYENRCEEFKTKAKDKYHSDPVYRQRKLDLMKAKRDAAKAAKAAAKRIDQNA